MDSKNTQSTGPAESSAPANTPPGKPAAQSPAPVSSPQPPVTPEQGKNKPAPAPKSPGAKPKPLFMIIGVVILVLILITVLSLSALSGPKSAPNGQDQSRLSPTPTEIPWPTSIFNDQSAAPLSAAAGEDMDGWKTFKNGNYSFLYPPELTPQQDENDQNTFYFLPANSASDSGIIVFRAAPYIKKDTADIDDNADFDTLQNSNVDMTESYIRVAGNVARDVTKAVDDRSTEGYNHYTLFYHGDKKFRFSCYCHHLVKKDANNRDVVTDMLYKMLNSFDFHKGSTQFVMPPDAPSGITGNDKIRQTDLMILAYDMLFGLQEGTLSSLSLAPCVPQNPCNMSNDTVVINRLDICPYHVPKFGAGLLFDPDKGRLTSISNCSSTYDTKYLVYVDALKNKLTTVAINPDYKYFTFTVNLPPAYTNSQ